MNGLGLSETAVMHADVSKICRAAAAYMACTALCAQMEKPLLQTCSLQPSYNQRILFSVYKAGEVESNVRIPRCGGPAECA